MGNKIGVLLLFGLSLVSSLELKYNSLESYLRIMELRPFAMEFAQHFKNISEADLDLPNTRLPSQQDLRCLSDMNQLLGGLASGKLWSLQMLDSWGSIPNGIFYGNAINLGNYDECIGIMKAISESSNIQGKYCLAKLPILQSFNIPAQIVIGICFPSSCSGAHISAFLKQLLQRLLGLDLKTQLISDDSCRTSDRAPFDGLTIFTIVLLSVLGFAIVLATLCDYFLYEDQKKLPIVVKAFSIRANSRALFKMVEPKSNPNIIDCLHGIRCMSLLWVIFGHEYIIAVMSPNMNYIKMFSWVGKAFPSFVFHAVFAVDTFLFLSGLLLVMISMRALEKSKGKLNIPMMYVHRYLRLAPIVAVAILMYMKLLPYLGDGPLFGDINFDNYENCKNNWFWTLLFLQNYATKELCLIHTWYLAVDMQLYILSPIFLLCLYKWGKKAAAGIFVLMLLLSACLFCTMMTDKYYIYLENGKLSDEAQRKIYYATHTHAAPWLIGVLFGYFLHVNRSKKFQLNRIEIWLGWIASLALLFTCVFALYPSAKLMSPALSILKESSYYTFTRIAWPLGLCWVVFVCVKDYGGLANSFLSCPLWQPLSKISYSAYIFHVFIQQINGRRVRANTYFSDYDVMLRFWANFGFTLLLSYVMYITMEAPVAVLQGMLLPKARTTPKPTEEVKTESTREVNNLAETETMPEIEHSEEMLEANLEKRVEET